MTGVWTASLIALWIFTLGLAALLAGALRQLGLIQLRLGADPGALITDAGLDRGSVAPDFSAIDLESGETLQFYDLPARARLLAFIEPSCVACQSLVEGLTEIFSTRNDEFDFVVVCSDQVESCARFSRRNGLKLRVLVDTSGEAAQAFQVAMTPFTYFLDSERHVLVRGVANDWRGIESLLDQEGTVQAGRPWAAIEKEVAVDGRSGI